ncbi:hypothetical protein [Streptomyces sp. NPDC012466]|uniref:hypothetical protein n=1 Tax=Streptomyces sp. NPDC012466 TaxID=3364835 RepID=UPI0036E43C0F
MGRSGAVPAESSGSGRFRSAARRHGTFSVVAAAIAFAPARWEGAVVPSALSRCGIAFAASLTLRLAVFAALDRT